MTAIALAPTRSDDDKESLLYVVSMSELLAELYRNQFNHDTFQGSNLTSQTHFSWRQRLLYRLGFLRVSRKPSTDAFSKATRRDISVLENSLGASISNSALSYVQVSNSYWALGVFAAAYKDSDNPFGAFRSTSLSRASSSSLTLFRRTIVGKSQYEVSGQRKIEHLRHTATYTTIYLRTEEKAQCKLWRSTWKASKTSLILSLQAKCKSRKT